MEKTKTLVRADKSAGSTKPKNSIGKQLLYHKELYLLLLPVLLLAFVFCYLPMLGVVIAFKNYDVFSAGGQPFNAIFASPWADSYGFQHFIDVFTTPDMLKAIFNTLYLSFLSIVVCFPFPIILAIMINEIQSGVLKRPLQTISYFPYFLSWISVVGIFQTFLDTNGVVNSAISFFGGEKINFLTSNAWFVPIAVFINLWKTVGWNSIIYLAAIMSIDSTLYEAAEIDGAGRLKQITHVLLPGILPTISILFILNMASIVNSNFELIYGLQNSYINFETINTLVYKIGIQGDDYSASTAIGFAQGLVSAILVIGTNKITKKLSGSSLF